MKNVKEDLKKIEDIIKNLELNSQSHLKVLLQDFLRNHLKKSKLENFIGDYPTFIEPVYLEANTKIGDDVLLGPNVYIGKNCEIKDYVELSNTIILDNVKIGENIKLDSCIIGKNTTLNLANITIDNCVLVGDVSNKEDLYKIMHKFE